MIVKKLFWNKQVDLDKVIAELKQGKVVIGTSDTVLGLMANCTLDGFNHLNAIKGRYEKPYVVLLKSQKNIELFVDKNELLQIENILKVCWPGPLTVILPVKDTVPSFMKSTDGTIAFRVPQHEGLQKLLSHFIGVFSTSANRTGNPVPSLVEDLDPYIVEHGVYCIIDDHYKQSTIPSTIVQWTHGDLKLIREGAYPVNTLEKLLQKPVIVP